MIVQRIRVVRRARVKPSRRGLDQRSISLRDSVFLGRTCHCVVPAAKVLEVRKLRFSAEQIVLDHTVKIVVDEQRSIRNQERRLSQHIVDRRQQLSELRAEVCAMAGPFLETAIPEPPFLVSDQHDPFDQRSCRDDIAVVDLEPHHLQVILNVARENELNAFDFFRKQVERIAPIDIPRNLLTKISDIADGLFPIDHTGHCVATSVRGFNNGGPPMIRDIAQPKWDGIPFKDMPHGDAKRRPGKLDEREHGAYMTEVEENFNIGENPVMNRRSESAIACISG